MTDETFEEVGSYRLTRLNIYLLISSVAVVTFLLVYLAIIFTPLKRTVPGYGDVNLRGEVEEYSKREQELEAKYIADSIYLSSVRRVLTGDFEYEDDVRLDTIAGDYQDSVAVVDRIAEDEELRNAVEQDEPLVEVAEDPEPTQGSGEFYADRNIPLEQLFLVAPLRGEVSYAFKPEEGHYGVDILGPKNTPIKSMMDGKVIQSDWTLETGHTIAVQHANNIVTFYKHNSTLLKKVGATVKAGEAIAIIGNTGTLSTGPHLHFEMWHNGSPINPVDYISF